MPNIKAAALEGSELDFLIFQFGLSQIIKQPVHISKKLQILHSFDIYIITKYAH